VPHAQAALAAFEKRERARDDPSAAALRRRGALGSAREDAVPSFLNGRQLRAYQLDSLRWMVANMRAGRNCILGDEMARHPSSSAPFTRTPSAPYRLSRRTLP
jgi:SNF2 family DNA or RNA helicase